MEQPRFPRPQLTGAALHLLAMGLMLIDHAWGTGRFVGTPFATAAACLGRVAFPFFAFLLVEGFFHTHDLRRYLLRMLVFALISEIPFDLMYSGVPFYPYHQNVLWTFLLALCCLWAAERLRQSGRHPVLKVLGLLGLVLGGSLLATVTMADYYASGILTVFAFYLFRGRKWWCCLGQLAVLYWLNVEVLGGLCYPVTLFGHEFELVQQGCALAALPLLWLYRGKQGYHSKWFRWFCYAFYPAHCLLLWLV